MRFISLLIFLLFILQTVQAQDWTLAKDKDGVKVYTRKVEGWGIKEYKVVTQIKASFIKVVNAIKDVPGRYKWIHDVLEVREVERPNSEVVCIYTKVDAPWPVADRDNITQFSFTYPDSKTARVDMKLYKTHAKAPVYDGVVRVPRLAGYWLVKDLGNGSVELTQQCVAEPGGSLPDWLVNSAVVDNPYHSMYNFKKYVEK